MLTGGHFDVRIETSVVEKRALVPVDTKIVEVMGWKSDGIVFSR